MSDPGYISLRDAAAELGVPFAMLRALSRQKGSGFPSVLALTARTVLVRREEWEAWLESRREDGEVIERRAAAVRSGGTEPYRLPAPSRAGRQHLGGRPQPRADHG